MLMTRRTRRMVLLGRTSKSAGKDITIVAAALLSMSHTHVTEDCVVGKWSLGHRAFVKKGEQPLDSPWHRGIEYSPQRFPSRMRETHRVDRDT